MSPHVYTEGSLELAERIVAVLEEGRFTATYKYAVLIALMDLCMEGTSASGAAPDMVTTRQLAEKVVEIYWPQTQLWQAGSASQRVLTQNSSDPRSQAQIVKYIVEFRASAGADPSATLSQRRLGDPGRYARLVDRVERKLIQMPLPRLQYTAEHENRFLYDIAWTRSDTDKEGWKLLGPLVRDYQQDGGKKFDNRIHLRPGAGDTLVRLNGVLRPLIHREWMNMVGRLNRLPESQLARFLFDQARQATASVRQDLWDLQAGRCFYCNGHIRGLATAHVDHFIPWARYPDNSLSNLVVAHDKCNGSKKHYLAAHAHVERWRGLKSDIVALDQIARNHTWELNPSQTLGVARAVYLGLPRDSRLWVMGKAFEVIDHAELRRALADNS